MVDKLTPAMQQFMDIKNANKDCIVLFRMGDFYETFFDDAKVASQVLGITLTKRGKTNNMDIPLAGVPHHAVENHIGKLVKNGYKVAIVEQLEDPKFAKGTVKRGLVKIITPGTIMESNLLDKKNNYIMAIAIYEGRYGISFIDISTGEFIVSVVEDEKKLFSEIFKYDPSEILLPTTYEHSVEEEKLKTETKKYISFYSDVFFYHNNAKKNIKEQFKLQSLDGLGLDDKELAVSSAGALLCYINDTQKKSLNYLKLPKYYSASDFMDLDPVTIRNLELVNRISDGSKKGTLLDILDKTVTNMGTRKMREFFIKPLIDTKKIRARLMAVKELVEKPFMKEDLINLLKQVKDIERISSRINYGNSNPRDLIGLKNSLSVIPDIKSILDQSESVLLKKLGEFDVLKNIHDKIEKVIVDEPPILLNNGGVIKKGFNKDLDEIKDISLNAKKHIRNMEDEERKSTGIKSLKIKYNRVFGYYIDVTKKNLELVPDNYIKRQTLVNSDRFITPALKEKEEIILGAEEKLVSFEQKIFQELIEEISFETKKLQKVADSLSYVDVMCSFSSVALTNNYVMPVVDKAYDIEIINGRHPVIETLTDFVPNDTFLNKNSKVMIITGPNMAGKSTVMRQVALITLMAQIGSFVPATKVKIGIVDKLFTRIGASDDLSRGQSTFLVEMNQTANILNNATKNSLIILDEIGRGTSTYDGVAIAWAVAEHIAKNIKAKTLFATHYHTLNNLAKDIPGIKNYNIAVRDEYDEIVFLRKLIEGGTNKSYGVHVAKLAGLPQKVIERSREIQFKLEGEDRITEKIVVETKKTKEKDKVTNQVEETSRIIKTKQMRLVDTE
ncbi:DNA mismatch repair protein MutS [archaeon]|nr:DNA mismatch repair protein MutS [archaeon]